MSTAWQREGRQRRSAGLGAWSAALTGLVLLVACQDRREERSSSDGVAAVTPDTSGQTPAAGDTTAPASEPSTTSGADSAARDTEKSAPAEKPAPAKKPAPRPAQPAPQQTTGQQPTDTAAGQAPAAEAPLRDPYHQAPRDTVSQAVYQGWKQFNLNCARCHGEDVMGTTIAPHLIVSLKPDGPINSKELFVQTVCAGRPAKGMPAWCSLGLEMDKINEIYSYVKGRSDGKIGPGRPAVRQ
jgi:mono/diheme cytochrome c family protein